MSQEHPNAALTRRVFAAFGKDAMAISAAFSRQIVWRVPGNTAVSGEYHGRREVVEFLRRTGLETNGTYRSSLQTVFANDEWAVASRRYMSADSITKALADPLDEPEEVIAIAAAA